MIRLISYVLFFVLGTHLAYSQEQQNALPNTAVMFSFNGFKLNPFSTADDTLIGGFGIKKFLNDQTALVAGVGFSRLSLSQFVDEDYTDYKESVTQLSFLLGFQKYLTSRKRVTPYVGGNFGFGKASFKQEPIRLKENGTERESTFSSTAIGFSGVFGLEYWLSKSISFAGEYGFGWSRATSKSEDKTENETIEDEGPTVTLMGIGSSALILSIYF